jgi:hypothetical protein
LTYEQKQTHKIQRSPSNRVQIYRIIIVVPIVVNFRGGFCSCRPGLAAAAVGMIFCGGGCLLLVGRSRRLVGSRCNSRRRSHSSSGSRWRTFLIAGIIQGGKKVAGRLVYCVRGLYCAHARGIAKRKQSWIGGDNMMGPIRKQTEWEPQGYRTIIQHRNNQDIRERVHMHTRRKHSIPVFRIGTERTWGFIHTVVIVSQRCSIVMLARTMLPDFPFSLSLSIARRMSLSSRSFLYPFFEESNERTEQVTLRIYCCCCCRCRCCCC